MTENRVGVMNRFRRLIIGMVLLTLVLVPASPALAGSGDDGIRIQDGLLQYPEGHYLEGQPLTSGKDGYGYNYQAHGFRGYFINFILMWPFSGTDGNQYPGLPPYHGDAPAYLTAHPQAEYHPYWEYRDLHLVMHWSDSYFSNRGGQAGGFVNVSGFRPGSGAWVTNHVSGAYIGDDNKRHQWTNSIKLMAPPDDAYRDGNTWYLGNGAELGLYSDGGVLIHSVLNDRYGGAYGLAYRSPVSPGIGFYRAD